MLGLQQRFENEVGHADAGCLGAVRMSFSWRSVARRLMRLARIVLARECVIVRPRFQYRTYIVRHCRMNITSDWSRHMRAEESFHIRPDPAPGITHYFFAGAGLGCLGMASGSVCAALFMNSLVFCIL